MAAWWVSTLPRSPPRNMEGLGFAIPADTVQPIVTDLMEYGYVKDRPMLGITGYYLNALQAAWNNVPSGFLVGEVSSEEAARSGLQANDIITAIDDTQVTSANTIATYIADKKPGDTVKLTVYRYSTGKKRGDRAGAFREHWFER